MIYYVATLARYVLVDAPNEEEARLAGHDGLVAQHADLRELLGRGVPIQIRTVRLATPEEIEDCRWNEETLARETEMQGQCTIG